MYKRILLLAVCLFLIGIASGIQAQDSTIIGPDTYPEGTNPLTGLPVANPENLNRRPLAIKIMNGNLQSRPQSGLMEADIVWEHLLSAGITRFTAIYLGNDVDHVGPIRSLRLVDFELTRIFRTLTVYSGVSEGTLEILRGDAWMRQHAYGGESPCPALCRFPESGKPLEYTLFGDTTAIREHIDTLDKDTAPQPVYGMAFSETPPANGVPINAATIAYRSTPVRWDYDADSGRWLRTQDNEPHYISETSDVQVNTANIMIIEDDHVEQPYVSEGYWGPANYAFSVNLIGSGRAYLLRDGQYFEGRWQRETREDPLSYVDLEGNPLPFKPGNTFIQLVPRWVEGYQLTFYLEQPPEVTVTVGSANLRGGPGTGYPASGAAFNGDKFPAIGRNNAGDWIQILVEDKVLWASNQIVTLGDYDVMQLPAVRSTIEG